MLLKRSMSLREEEYKKIVRDSNIELLRIIAMCGIIILHYNGYIGHALETVEKGSLNHGILLGFEGFFVCTVDLFVLITGYFCCQTQKRDLSKVIGFLVQVIMFRLAVEVLRAMLSHTFSAKDLLTALLPVNYFAVLYVALYLISPYINLCLRQLTKTQLRKMIITVLLLFSVFPVLTDIVELIAGHSMTGLNPVSADGDGSGYTIVNFAVMYLVGAYLRLADIKIKKSYLLMGLACCVGIFAVGSWLGYSDLVGQYCNPVVILEAACLFLLFRKFHFESKIVNQLSKAAFTCFLFHPYILSKLQIGSAVQRPWWYLLGHVLFACITIYLLSWVAYKIYSIFEKPFLRLVKWMLRKYKIDVSV